MTPWYERGACRGNTEAEFFPEKHSDVAAIDRAYALCRACPLDVREKCQALADESEAWGIWNGINRQPSVEQTLRQRARRGAEKHDAEVQRRKAYFKARWRAQVAAKDAARAQAELEALLTEVEQ